jgi:hypothetical protein
MCNTSSIAFAISTESFATSLALMPLVPSLSLAKKLRAAWWIRQEPEDGIFLAPWVDAYDGLRALHYLRPALLPAAVGDPSSSTSGYSPLGNWQ